MKELVYHQLSVRRLNGPLPKLPYQNFYREILGKDFELSIVFVSPKISRELNQKWRGKNLPANILTFRLSENSGEIFISAAQKSAKDFSENLETFLKRLLVHGLLHLKGLTHGSTMEKQEQEFLDKESQNKNYGQTSDRRH